MSLCLNREVKTIHITSRQTPLHLAVLNNHEGSVTAIIDHKRLVEKGDLPATDRSNVSLVPNLNLKNSEGDTPVSLALTEGKENLLLFLKSNQFHAVSRTQQDRQKEPSV